MNLKLLIDHGAKTFARSCARVLSYVGLTRKVMFAGSCLRDAAVMGRDLQRWG